MFKKNSKYLESLKDIDTMSHGLSREEIHGVIEHTNKQNQHLENKRKEASAFRDPYYNNQQKNK